MSMFLYIVLSGTCAKEKNKNRYSN